MCDKPCRFALVGGNPILKVFRHCRSLAYNWVRSMYWPLFVVGALPRSKHECPGLVESGRSIEQAAAAITRTCDR